MFVLRLEMGWVGMDTVPLGPGSVSSNRIGLRGPPGEDEQNEVLVGLVACHTANQGPG